MGPKKLQEGEWRSVIEEAQLNDDRFKVQVIVMESAGSEEDILYLRKFEIFAFESKRFVIRNICETETMFMINQLGVDKKVEDPSLRVFEEGYAYLKEKQNIPSDVLALIIKHLIINMKKEYFTIKRQKIEVKEGLQIESSIMLTNTDVRALDEVIPEVESIPAPTPKKGKYVEVEEVPAPVPGKKYNTMLRVAGEDWRDRVYVDDYPLDGPNLYVAVSGFGDPFLPMNLVKLGVPLAATVQIRIDEPPDNKDSSMSRVPKRGKSYQERLHDKAIQFWQELQSIRLNVNYSDILKDTAFIIYYPKAPNVACGNSETFYDQLSYLMYDVQDLTRQHKHYLNNMNIIQIPTQPHASEYFFRYYGYNLKHIPLECVTIYNILDSILQTVSLMFHEISWDNEEEFDSLDSSLLGGSTRSKNTANRKFEIAANIVNKFFETFNSTESEKKTYRSTYGDEYENYDHPFIVSYGDFATYSLLNVANVNVDNIINAALSRTPLYQLWESVGHITEEIYDKITLHLNLLVSCFDRKIVHLSELYRLIHILSCRKLYDNRSSLRKQPVPIKNNHEFKRIYLKRNVLVFPLSKPSSLQNSSILLPRSFSKISSMQINESSRDEDVDSIRLFYDCPDIVELVSVTELGNTMGHMIEDFEYFEDFNGTSALQIMLEAFNNYNCVDYKYSEITDSIILMFFNSHDENGISREDWRYHLETPVCLQDFYDYVLDEFYDWIFNEDKKMDEAATFLIPCEESKYAKVDMPVYCIDNLDIAAELLIEGSVKYQLEQENTSVTSIVSNIKKDKESKATTIKNTPSIKSRVSAHFEARVEEQDMEQKDKLFTGYNLGERRVEALGRDSNFYSEDGTRVSCFYILLIPEDLEFLALNINPGNAENNFWMHKTLGKDAIPDIKRKCNSFRVVCKNQIFINLVQNSYEITESRQMLSDKAHKKNFHSLYVTWPNGLITQTIHKNHSAEISHIKQFFVAPKAHLNEEERCVSLNGEVIIFKKSGEIEVLKPDSTYIKITKYNKHVSPDILLNNIKPPPKNKPNAPTLQALPMNQEEKNLEYDMHINTFEIIEPNGIRTIYSNNIPFEIEKYLIRETTIYIRQEKYSRRMDGTNIFYNGEGTRVTTFPDGTRIISACIIEDDEVFPEWTEEEILSFELLKNRGSNISVSEMNEVTSHISKNDGFVSILLKYTIEHDDLTTVSINKCTKKINITASANNTEIAIDLAIDEHINYDIKLDDMTTAKFDGNYLNINYEACAKCKVFTECQVNITGNPILNITGNLIGNNPDSEDQMWLNLKDCYGKTIFVNFEGCIDLLTPDVISTLSKTEYDRASAVANERVGVAKYSKHTECREINKAKSQRFFILRRDNSCSELIHRNLVDLYKNSCTPRPWCFIERHNDLKGYRTLHTMLKPVNYIEEHLHLESVTKLSPQEVKPETKGHYKWMRPYKRFVSEPFIVWKPKPLLSRRVFVFRLLERMWNEMIRHKLKGAQELLKAVIKYKHLILSSTNLSKINITSLLSTPRFHILSSEEIDYIESIVQSKVKDFKIFLKQDMLSRTKLSITTKPPTKRKLMSMECEVADSVRRKLEEEVANREKEVILKQKRRHLYWLKRQEQRNQEEFYLFLLHDPRVPPYFRNIHGGAIWWDLNHLAEKAASSYNNRLY